MHVSLSYICYYKLCYTAVVIIHVYVGLVLRKGSNKGADQPAHQPSLVSTFVICLLKSITVNPVLSGHSKEDQK